MCLLPTPTPRPNPHPRPHPTQYLDAETMGGLTTKRSDSCDLCGLRLARDGSHSCGYALLRVMVHDASALPGHEPTHLPSLLLIRECDYPVVILSRVSQRVLASLDMRAQFAFRRLNQAVGAVVGKDTPLGLVRFPALVSRGSLLDPDPGKGLFSLCGLSATADASMLRALVSAKPTQAPADFASSGTVSASYLHPVLQTHQICMYTGLAVEKMGDGDLAGISFNSKRIDPTLAGGVAYYANLAHSPRFTAEPCLSHPYSSPDNDSTYLIAAKTVSGIVEVTWDYNATTDDPNDGLLRARCRCGCGNSIIEFVPA